MNIVRVEHLARKTNFKFEGIDPETGKPFKITISGWIPEELLETIKKYINKILSTSDESYQESIDAEQLFDIDSLPIKKKVEILIIRNFHRGWFTSKDVQEQYKIVFNEEIKASTVSMCLQRLYSQDGILERRGSRAQRAYRLISEKVKNKIEEYAKLRLF